jgi:hypothetical protein
MPPAMPPAVPHPARPPAFTEIRLLIVFACAAFAGLVCADIARSVTQMPLYEGWPFAVPIAARTAEGTLQFGDFFQWTDGHRRVPAYMTTAVFAALTRWDLQAQAYVTVALVLGAAVGWLALVDRTVGRWAVWALAVPVFALAFTLRGRHTWLSSFESGSAYLLVFYTLALLVLVPRGAGPSGRRWPRLLAAACLCAFATFSVSGGVMAWAALLPVLWLLGYRRPAHYAVWAAVFALTLFVFLQGSPGSTGALDALSQPLRISDYSLLHLTAPFVPLGETANSDVYQLAGLGGALAVAVWAASAWAAWHTHSPRVLAPWIGLGLFTLGTAGFTAFGGVNSFAFNPSLVVSERYVLHIVPFWISLAVLGILCSMAIQRGKAGSPAAEPTAYTARALGLARVIAPVHTILWAALVPLAVVAALSVMQQPSAIETQRSECVTHHLFFPGEAERCVTTILPRVPAESWRAGVDQLFAQRLAYFSGAAFDAPIPAACYRPAAGCPIRIPPPIARVVFSVDDDGTEAAAPGSFGIEIRAGSDTGERTIAASDAPRSSPISLDAAVLAARTDLRLFVTVRVPAEAQPAPNVHMQAVFTQAMEGR